MPAKTVVSVEGNLQNIGIPLTDLAKEREILDPPAMAEMLYQNFEDNIERLTSEQGVVLPPPTDMNGNVWAGYDNQEHMTRVAHAGASGNNRHSQMPVSNFEKAISTLLDIREDMIKQYASVSKDPSSAATVAMGIHKLDAQIISMGGEVDRFDPEQYQSGLKDVPQVVDQKYAATQVVENTRQAYNLKPIKKIYSGVNKSGKQGVCVKIALQDGLAVRGTVVPKGFFTGEEVIDYVPNANKGRMTVKTASSGRWEDISHKFEIAWIVEKDVD